MATSVIVAVLGRPDTGGQSLVFGPRRNRQHQSSDNDNRDNGIEPPLPVREGPRVPPVALLVFLPAAARAAIVAADGRVPCAHACLPESAINCLCPDEASYEGPR